MPEVTWRPVEISLQLISDVFLGTAVWSKSPSWLVCCRCQPAARRCTVSGRALRPWHVALLGTLASSVVCAPPPSPASVRPQYIRRPAVLYPLGPFARAI
ncbi:unnamed protein product [Laminaria digitata]